MIAKSKWPIIPHETLLSLAVLILVHIVISCASLVYVSYASSAPNPPYFTLPSHFNASSYHIFYDHSRVYDAIATVGTFAITSLLFTVAGFSFGYLVGFYLYTMILTYLWLGGFSDLIYNHKLASFSAATSAVAFLVPALLVTAPAPRTYTLSARALEHGLAVILLIAIATIAIGGLYNFRFIDLGQVYEIRNKLQFPTILNYMIGITSTALLPFAFACFTLQKRPWRGVATLLLLLLFYPVTLNKFAFFTPLWIFALLLISRTFSARTSVLLSLLLPTLLGFLFVFFQSDLPTLVLKWGTQYFFWVNFRVFAIPGTAMDVYNDFFSKHELTYFCQISVLKPFIACPYTDPLSVVMERNYHLGNFNASLFATEGIASVGPLFAPALALVCGLIIALGNRVSAGLPPAFVLISGGVLSQALLNVPLSTIMLTHGGGILFLLWYVTPREIFELNSA